MINVGCHFGPDDLPADVWDGLVLMALERQFVDRIIDKRRDRKREFEADHNKALQKAGIPGPGQSLFPK